MFSDLHLTKPLFECLQMQEHVVVINVACMLFVKLVFVNASLGLLEMVTLALVSDLLFNEN